MTISSGLQHGFPGHIPGRRHKKILQADRAAAPWSGNAEAGAKGQQGRRGIRGMDNETILAAENAMVLVFAVYRIAVFSPLAQAVKFAPVVPAARLLAEIAAQGALVADLRTAHGRRPLGQGRIFLPDEGMGGHLGDGGQGADT